MGVIGGFIGRLGLVRLGGASTKELDMESNYFQPTQNHSSNHPVSINWYFPIAGRNNADASNSTLITNQRALVAGTVLESCFECFINTKTLDMHANLRVNSVNNLIYAVPPATTGTFLNTDMNVPFDKLDVLNYQNTSIGGSGNTDCKFTSIIYWD